MARILVAESNDKIRSLVRAVIETRAGWHISEAKDGHDAVSRALELKPDLVVLDFAMGGLNGLQAAAKIVAACPNLPTILHTFYDFSEMIAEAKKVGIREVVSKGESGDRLLEAIEKHLDRRAKSASVLPTDTKIADPTIKRRTTGVGGLPCMAKPKDTRSNKLTATKPATVKKIIESPHPEIPEKAEISIDGCDPLYQELRIENKLTDEKGNEVKLKPGAHIDVTLEADPNDTTPKR